MDSLLVLGQIPGTEIRITFTGWLIIFAGVVASAIIYTYIHRGSSLKFKLQITNIWFNLKHLRAK